MNRSELAKYRQKLYRELVEAEDVFDARPTYRTLAKKQAAEDAWRAAELARPMADDREATDEQVADFFRVSK